MKLRHDKGKPLIVLEAGDVSCLERAAGLLAHASIHVGEFPDGTLQDLADGLRSVLRGESPGIRLPKKRAKHETNGDTEPGDSHVIDEPTSATHVLCHECNRALSRGEVKRGGACFVCQPIVEGAA